MNFVNLAWGDCLNLHVPYCGLCGLCTCARVYEGACLSSKVLLFLFALALCLSGAVCDVVTKCAKMLNQMIKYFFPMMIIINQFIRPKSLTRLQGNIDYHWRLIVDNLAILRHHRYHRVMIQLGYMGAPITYCCWLLYLVSPFLSNPNIWQRAAPLRLG